MHSTALPSTIPVRPPDTLYCDFISLHGARLGMVAIPSWYHHFSTHPLFCAILQVGSLRMVLSLEELGPAVQQAPHQGPVDTATAAAAAAAQPTASLGAAAQPATLTSSAGSQQAAANPVSAAQQATGSTMPGSLTM